MDNVERAKPSKLLQWAYTALAKMVKKNLMHPFLLHSYRNSIPIFYKELDYMRHRLIQDLQNSSDIKNFNLFKFMEKRSVRYVASIQHNNKFH